MFEELLFNPEEATDGGMYPTTIGMFHGGVNNFYNLGRVNASGVVVDNPHAAYGGYQHAGARVESLACFYGGRDELYGVQNTLRFYNHAGTFQSLRSAPSLGLSHTGAAINNTGLFYGSNHDANGFRTLTRVTNTTQQDTDVGVGRRYSSGATIGQSMVVYGGIPIANTPMKFNEAGVLTTTTTSVGTAGYYIGAVGLGDVGIWWGGAGGRSNLTIRLNENLGAISVEFVNSLNDQQQTTATVESIGIYISSSSCYGVNAAGTVVVAIHQVSINKYEAAGCGL